MSLSGKASVVGLVLIGPTVALCSLRSGVPPPPDFPCLALLFAVGVTLWLVVRWPFGRLPCLAHPARAVRHAGAHTDPPPLVLAVDSKGTSGFSAVIKGMLGRWLPRRRTLHDSQESLRDGQEHLRAAVSAVPGALFVFDREGMITLAQGRALESLGVKPDEVNGRSIFDIYGDTPEARESIRRVLDGKPFTATAELGGLTFEAHCSPLRAPDGEIVGVVGVATNITGRLRAEVAEREQRVLAEALCDTAAALSGTLELDELLDRILLNLGRVVPHDAANIMLVEEGVARVVRCTGYAERGVEVDLLAERFPLAETRNLRHIAETGEPLAIPDVDQYEGWVRSPGIDWARAYVGAPIILEDEVIGFLSLDSATPGFFNAGHAGRLRAFADQAAIAFRNARLYQALRDRAAELEARNTELDAFSQTVTHQLKAPLHIIIGYSDLLATDFADQMSDEVRSYLGYVEAYGLKMNDIIEKLMLLARLRYAEVPVGRVEVRPVIEAARARFEERTYVQRVTFEVAADLPPVHGFAPWLEEVFANLFDNAAKYIGEHHLDPKVTVRGTCQAGVARYEVVDNGPGIPPEYLEEVFAPFKRLHSPRIAGAGLGLSIVERIITGLGGEVGVESVLGEGSTFWFTLPCAEA
jgi:PAS domain S-box-containing protein